MGKSNLMHLAALQSTSNVALGRSPFLPSFGQPILSDLPVMQTGHTDDNPVQLAQVGGLSLDKLPIGLSALQQEQQQPQLESAGALEKMGRFSDVVSNVQQVSPNSNTLLMQVLQQQQGGSQLLGQGGSIMSTTGNVGLQGLSTDADVWVTAMSSLNGNLGMVGGLSGQCIATSRLGSLSGASSGSATQVSLGKVPDQECKGQQGLSTDRGVWGTSLSNLSSIANASNGCSGQSSGNLDYRSADLAGSGPGNAPSDYGHVSFTPTPSSGCTGRPSCSSQGLQREHGDLFGSGFSHSSKRVLKTSFKYGF
ncbi:hypothetical protein KP509_08G048900 [Ceratopteris richardii]|uniref:Uncharacterized protein n=1 Tax=Ceratopteris richardii TaxID=49495 RepID=A0A8T2U7V0_CERRI|nr:hypothetical protein KP509_08G048900 [Ceratopteris richardii]